LFAAAAALWSQGTGSCSCGVQPPGRPENRELRPYAAAPEDLRPYTKFTTPYYEHYTKLVEYNGPARETPIPSLTDINEVRIGFLGPIENHPDEALGKAMLNGVTLAMEEANAKGGYCGKPFRLMVHNDQAIWGSSSNEVVKMVYDDRVWAIFGSISGDSTHIALRVALKAEVPMVNSAATDPTIPETIIPWYLTVLQDDRVQSYTLARRIYSDLGLKRVAILRINDRYGRFGVRKFKDASRRLGHPVVIEQKYMYGDTDFSRQLRVIQDSRVDAVVLWSDAAPAGMILKQMREMGMKQRVFGGFRVLGDDLFKNAGAAAEGLEVVFPYDPTRTDDAWLAFNERFGKRFGAKPDTLASLGYDAMKVLLDSICRAGLSRGLIRDALTGIERHKGVTGDMVFDPNCKNIAPMYLGTVRDGRVNFRRYPMEKPYARVGETPVEYNGPRLANLPEGPRVVALFGPAADRLAATDPLKRAAGDYRLVGIDSETAWGKASTELVKALYDERAIGVIATDRKGAHLALQLANKVQLPVLAISDDSSLTSVNIPWVFRLPSSTPPVNALECLLAAAGKAAPNREDVRRVLASGAVLPGGLRFNSIGEPGR
jgi:ABC-type branched-subunit amino acid transport system substrate-binding protein